MKFSQEDNDNVTLPEAGPSLGNPAVTFEQTNCMCCCELK